MDEDTMTPRERAEKAERLEKLRAEAEELESELNKPDCSWPRVHKFYLHGDKEDNAYTAKEKLGLLSEESVRRFMYTAYEIELTLEVHADGEAWITHCEGEELANPVRAN